MARRLNEANLRMAGVAATGVTAVVLLLGSIPVVGVTLSTQLLSGINLGTVLGLGHIGLAYALYKKMV